MIVDDVAIRCALECVCEMRPVVLLAFERDPKLDAKLDRIRDRFGSSAITRGVLIGRDQGPWVPLLPD